MLQTLSMVATKSFLHFYIVVFTVVETRRPEGEVKDPAIGARRRAQQKETHHAVESLW